MNLKILKTVFFTPGVNNRWGLPVILEGQPGTAKTSKIQDLMVECGLSLSSVIASLREPSDFLGLPIPRQMKDGTTGVEYAAAKWALDIAEAKHGLVFFDEMRAAIRTLHPSASYSARISQLVDEDTATKRSRASQDR